MNATQAGDELFESCLSTSSSSVSDNSVVHRTYCEPLRLLPEHTVTPQSPVDVCNLVSSPDRASLRSCNDDKAKTALTEKWHQPDMSHCPSAKVDVSALNSDQSDCSVADVRSTVEPNSLLNRAFNSLHISSNSGTGDSSDLTSITVLSSDSSCFLHSVRIERQAVVDDDEDGHCSLVETVLIPTDDADANTSCQHECAYLSDSQSFLSDWKTASDAANENVDDVRVELTVPAFVKQLSPAELRARLVEFGESPGPIVDSTRSLHELRLSRLLAGCDRQKKTSADNGFSAGLSTYFSHPVNHLYTKKSHIVLFCGSDCFPGF